MINSTAVVSCLLILAYQDWRYRAVSWIIFPVLIAIMSLISVEVLTLPVFFTNMLINVGFLVSQLGLVTLYFSMKNKRWVNITRGYLGWGDVLFLISLCFYLSPLNYLIYYVLSLCVVLVFSLILMKMTGAPNGYRIPLAGFQATLFLFFLVLDWSNRSFSLQSNDWILMFLN